ncbi:hypothetical protein GSI_11819 [Ganoderma sinense ZZ0214-1]|uniref:Uncharacterized protein n=1 Tax=Ganoderma sinense ZZ0214-1 TaxID=1077348 RepID=A0A2G8RX18_9APHY|nr:hypothetical protein GSI_11819 [Ganoderma sinense ZZ0214-1]
MMAVSRSPQTLSALTTAATPPGASGSVTPAGRSLRPRTRQALLVRSTIISHLPNPPPSKLERPTNSRAPATLVEGPTDLHVFGGMGGTGARVDCAYASPTASGAAVVATCTAELTDGSTTLVQGAPPVSLVPIAVQASDGKSKPNGAGSLQISLGGVAVSALAILSTAGVMLVRV